MTAPDPATTGPDIIEAAVLNVVTKGEGYPVQLCSPERAHQHRSVACPSRGKRPLSPGWAAMSKAETMPDLGKWLDGGYNIGIVLDGDLVGLDEDVPGGLDVFFRALGEPIPTTMGDIVPVTGKRHLIARLHPDFDSSRLRGTWYSPEGKSLGELVHHRNKQLVAPGCRWSNSDGSLSDWRVWNQIDEFAVLSLAACEALVPPNQQIGFSSQQGSLSYGESPAAKVLSDWTWEPSLGSRHDFLRDEARRLRGSSSDPQAIADAVWEFGKQHLLVGAHPETGRVIDYPEVVDLATGAVQKFAPDLKLVVPRIERKERPAEEIRREAENFAASHEFVVVSRAVPNPTAGDWLVRDLLKPKGIVVLAGEEGLGKTHVRTELALRLSLGTGTMFGEYRVERAVKVLLFDEENGEDLEYEREADILDTLGVDRTTLGENYLRGSFMGTDFSTPEGQALFEAHIAKVEPDVVFVDTGGLVLAEEWGEPFKQAMKFARRISETYGVVLVFIVHMVKPNREDKAPKQGRAITEIMGHWSRTADATWQMSPVENERDKAIFEVRKRWGSSRYVIEKRDSIWVAVKGLDVARAVAEADTETTILSALMSATRKVEGSGGLLEWSEKGGRSLSKATAHRRLKAMAEQGLVSTHEGEWSVTEAGRSQFKATTLSIVLSLSDDETETDEPDG
jgi:hypothetical protein